MDAELRIHLLNELHGRSYFLPFPKGDVGDFNPHTYPHGRIWSHVLLRDLRAAVSARWTDEQIITELEALASEGRVKIFGVEDAAGVYHLQWDDIVFRCELAEADRDLRLSTTTITRSYNDEPLTEEERKSKTVILDIRRSVNELEELRNKYFQQQFPKIDCELEKRLHREHVEEASIEARSSERIAEGVDKLVELQGGKS